MKLATWNVNSIRVRKERLLAWLADRQPDVVCLQELKCPAEGFPSSELEAAGYHAVVVGQKTYNGVAILSKAELQAVHSSLSDDVDDPQARLVAAKVAGIDVICVYVPNGSEVGSDKFSYKIKWLGRLRKFLEMHYSADQPLVLCGDINITLDDLDVAFPERWKDSVLCTPQAREALACVLEFGLTDVVRHFYPQGKLYSWWDYRNLAFPKGDGLRIDHIFATKSLASKATTASVDREQRKGASPSDHAPVIAEFAL